jgi:hypothetical protein
LVGNREAHSIADATLDHTLQEDNERYVDDPEEHSQQGQITKGELEHHIAFAIPHSISYAAFRPHLDF